MLQPNTESGNKLSAFFFLFVPIYLFLMMTTQLWGGYDPILWIWTQHAKLNTLLHRS